jgi:hypothetical protein
MKNVGAQFPLTHFRVAPAGLRRQDGIDPWCSNALSSFFPHTGRHVLELPLCRPSMLIIIEQPLQFLEFSPFPWPKVSDMPTLQYLFPMIKVKVSSMATFRSWWPNVGYF